MVNKSSLIERIAELARDGHLEGLSDLRDESDRQGMRIVLELTKNADPNFVLRDLYKRTPMQTTFSINLLALVDGEPRTLTLKQALRVYLEHRLTVIKRRAQFDLEKAKARQHVLEGYLIALKNLNEIIELIRSAANEALQAYGYSSDCHSRYAVAPARRARTQKDRNRIQGSQRHDQGIDHAFEDTQTDARRCRG
jgi:DNA gyrase/topoisomerase IV subunit A